jgi:methionyl-tRNA synthetase
MPSQDKSVELRQFMGKDNILFHSIINPATLLATKQQWIKPKHMSVTEYLRYEGGKFSKSHGVGVFGDQCQ